MGFAWGAVPVPFDEPFGVVQLGELVNGLAQLVDGGVGPGPQALFLQGADEALGAPVGFGLPDLEAAPVGDVLRGGSGPSGEGRGGGLGVGSVVGVAAQSRLDMLRVGVAVTRPGQGRMT